MHQPCPDCCTERAPRVSKGNGIDSRSHIGGDGGRGGGGRRRGDADNDADDERTMVMCAYKSNELRLNFSNRPSFFFCLKYHHR